MSKKKTSDLQKTLTLLLQIIQAANGGYVDHIYADALITIITAVFLYDRFWPRKDRRKPDGTED
jgi:hypothetical protein